MSLNILRCIFWNPKKFYKECQGWLGFNQILYASCRDCGEHHHIKTLSGPGYHEQENMDNQPIVNGIYVTACINCGRKNKERKFF